MRPGRLDWIGRAPAASAGGHYSAQIPRLARWNSVGFLLICTVGLFWWAGDAFLQRSQSNDMRETTAYSPPPENAPPPSPAVETNTRTAELHLPRDLEGTAVLYPEEVDGLVGPDGGFRTNLSLGELSRILRIDPRTIARKGSHPEVDPDAVLFRAMTGRLSENAKVQSRQARQIQARMGMPSSAVGDEWVLTELAFSLNTLIRPNHHQKAVLEALSRSALHLDPQPGAGINAVPFWFDQHDKHTPFGGGYLPLERRPAESDPNAESDQ